MNHTQATCVWFITEQMYTSVKKDIYYFSYNKTQLDALTYSMEQSPSWEANQ